VQIEEVDEDFEKELAALMTDFKLPPSGPFPQARPDSPAGSSQQDPGSTVSFRVMMKRGGRDDRSKAVQVSVMSHVEFEKLLTQMTTTAIWLRSKALYRCLDVHIALSL